MIKEKKNSTVATKKANIFDKCDLKEGDIIVYKGFEGKVSLENGNPKIQYKKKDGSFAEKKCKIEIERKTDIKKI